MNVTETADNTDDSRRRHLPRREKGSPEEVEEQLEKHWKENVHIYSPAHGRIQTHASVEVVLSIVLKIEESPSFSFRVLSKLSTCC